MLLVKVAGRGREGWRGTAMEEGTMLGISTDDDDNGPYIPVTLTDPPHCHTLPPSTYPITTKGMEQYSVSVRGRGLKSLCASFWIVGTVGGGVEEEEGSVPNNIIEMIH